MPRKPKEPDEDDLQRGHGGFRYRAGRKKVWNLGQTKTIRVPGAIIPRLMQLARVLDEGGEVVEFANLPLNVESPPEGIVRWICVRATECVRATPD